jgi:methionyl aminopeptidase
MIPIKTRQEVEQMRAACRLASQILDEISTMLCPGMTTKEVDLAAARLMADAGCRSAFLGYKKFPGNIFVGDTAATVPIGEVSEDVQRLLEVTENALYSGIEKAREGRRLSAVCAAIQDAVEQNGFSVVREFVGHGVGRHLHEEPQIPNYRTAGATAKLKAGMTLAIEPMVNLGKAGVMLLPDNWTVVTADHTPSAHFEHTILVTKGEPEILTWREKTSSKLKAG